MPGAHRRAASLAATLAVTLAVSMAIVAVGAVAAATPSRVVDAEEYALRLLNCTRTGGWVRADGTCRDRGTGKHSTYRKPLPLHRGISKKVAWPWASDLVEAQVCGHSIAGEPDLSRRLELAGFHDHTYGENVGCGWGGGSPEGVVLAAHRSMQAEKASQGGHWRNIKNRDYKSVGIGVATRDGTTMVVWDFYGRRW